MGRIDALHRILTVFGKETPMSNGAGSVDHARNRRVEFRIVRGDVAFVLEEGELVDDSGNPIHASNNAQ